MAPAVVRFHPAAAQEAESAYDWYAARNTSAAYGFREELRHAVDAVADNPLTWPLLGSRVRALGRTRLRPGHSLTRIARELSVSEPTLAGWLRPRDRPSCAGSPEPEPPRADPVGLVLIAAPGVRGEGLDRAALIAVLRDPRRRISHALRRDGARPGPDSRGPAQSMAEWTRLLMVSMRSLCQGSGTRLLER
jgi:plasmid stabilization system protein ParE